MSAELDSAGVIEANALMERAREIVKTAKEKGFGCVMMTPYETKFHIATIRSRGFIQADSLDSKAGVKIVALALASGARFPELKLDAGNAALSAGDKNAD